MGNRIYIAHGWRWYWLMMGLFAVEVALTVACLALFGIADGDTYRTKLWQNGYDKGFNSAPNSILYDYANHRPIHIPLVWSNFTTQFNIIVSFLSMFILLTKSVMYMLHVFLPVISVVVHAILVSLYAVSLRNQATPDDSDPALPSPGGLPWYISKGCSYAAPANYGYCMQARASFAVTCVMVALFSIYFLWAAYNLIPTAAERTERTADRELAIELKTHVYDPEAAEAEAQRTRRRRNRGSRGIYPNIPKTPNTAVSAHNLMTPRTKAFSVLNGGEASAIGRSRPPPVASVPSSSASPASAKVSSAGPSRPLAFREQYADTSSAERA